MRKEILEIILKSGTISNEEISDGHKKMLQEFNLTPEKISQIELSEDDINNIKHQIYLEDLKITDDEIAEIAQTIVSLKPQTRCVCFDNNLLTDKGAQILCKELSKLMHLSSLMLGYNNIGYDGFLAIFSLYAQNQKLKLSLRGNQLMYANQVEDLKWKAVIDFETNKILYY